jgi:acetylornithine deacetylase
MKKLLLLAAWAACAAPAAAYDVDFLRRLIAVPSVSADIPEVNRAMRLMADYLSARGVCCTVETTPEGRDVLYAATSPGKRHDIVFSVHLDVVPAAAPEQFEMTRAGDRVEGRGVNDCKGKALAAAEVLIASAAAKKSVGCVFGPDEEIGGKSTDWMVNTRGYRPNRMVIVIDAGYGTVSYAHKGQTYVRIRAKGRSGHSSRPWTCDDSITKMMKAYVKIREIWDERHPLPEDKWSDVMVPTFVNADSGAWNLLPAEVELILNLRSVNPDAKDELAQLAREVAVGCEVEIVRHSPPVQTDPNHPLVRKLVKVMSARLGREVALNRMVAATDARWFTKCGVPIALIGNKGGGSHMATEHAFISNFDEMRAYLIDFIGAVDGE